MALRIRRLTLRAVTASGPVGTAIEFPDGLIVIRADNTTGKSTVLMGIMYALGLEGMTSPSHDVPFPHALTDRVEVDGREVDVLESAVQLEIENHRGETLAVQRQIKGEVSRHLVLTWNGPAFSEPEGNYERKDYFVRQRGASHSSRGFHTFLEQFVGWELPVVPSYDGGEMKLYMEGIFPFMFVEQKQGWAVLEGRFPTYLGIRQLSARAFEFLARLDAYDTSANRVAIRIEENRLRSQWEAKRTEIDRLARHLNAMIEGVPVSPTAEWPPAVPPKLVVAQGKGWHTVREEVARLAEEVTRLTQEALPPVKETIEETQERLPEAQAEIAELERIADQRLADIAAEQTQLESLSARLEALEEDLQRHKDAHRLLQLGSPESAVLAANSCPTCHQALSDSLLPQGGGGGVMTLEENIAFLHDQKRAFVLITANSTRALEAKEVGFHAVTAKLDAVRSETRSLRRTLVSDERLPSEATIQRRLTAEARLEALQKLEAEVSDEMNYFASSAEDWHSLQAEKAALPESTVSAMDRAKLAKFREFFLEQLAQYGFSSLPVSTIELSLDNYRPSVEGVDLQFDLSASDLVRSIWAYRLAFLELARGEETHHLGCLIMDEPGQQEMSATSFAALLARASRAGEHGQQVILATSERESVVREALEGYDHLLVAFTGRLLRTIR